MAGRLDYRVPLNTIGNGSGHEAYAGRLDAWSFWDIDADSWFQSFRDQITSSLGKKYLPVYRMADGEYRFLIGRKYNFHRRPLLRELVAVTVEKLRIKNPNKWKTSWGENYAPERAAALKKHLLENIREISKNGYLGCYINDNGLNAFIEYNNSILPFFSKNDIIFTPENYIPFHFAVNLFVGAGSRDLLRGRDILIVTGSNKNQQKISESLYRLGVNSVQYFPISNTASMIEVLDLGTISSPLDLCLVSAGIGSANILTQLKPLKTVCVDVGGFINLLEKTSRSIHGGFFLSPV